jgi:hypothetical protein
LPKETQEFLSLLCGDDIETLKDGLRLVFATRTVSGFVKWMIVAFWGIIVGALVLYENIIKIVSWVGQGKQLLKL